MHRIAVDNVMIKILYMKIREDLVSMTSVMILRTRGMSISTEWQNYMSPDMQRDTET